MPNFRRTRARFAAADLAAGRPAAAEASRLRLAAQAPWYAGTWSSPDYRERAFISARDQRPMTDAWGDFPDRLVRYDLFWAMFEGNIFRAVHRWGEGLKEDHDLYNHIRTIFSPATRIGKFWASHLLGGGLDPGAGDGSLAPSCLPILCDNPAIRPALARLFRDSRLAAIKDTIGRLGAVKGDVAVAVVDDAAAGMVYLRVVDPSTIEYLARDVRGNVREYVIQEQRVDPEAGGQGGPFSRRYCTYTEWARRQGDSVVYTTYRDRLPYDWKDYPPSYDGRPVGAEWSEPYGFIPLVFIQHEDMGLGWGWSEYQATHAKMFELDDVASKLNDQIRKIEGGERFVTGAAPGDVFLDRDAEAGDRDDGRERTGLFYCSNKDARLQSMLGDMPIADVAAYVRAFGEDLERDHPELQAENVGLAASGEARRVAREKVESDVLTKRAGYHDPLARVFQMALSIGGMKGYEGYTDFDADSYAAGDLALAIGDSPVFGVNVSDQLDVAARRSTVFKALADGGMPFRSAMEQAGYPAAAIAAAAKEKAEADAAAARLEADRQVAAMAQDRPEGEDPYIPGPAAGADDALPESTP